ncbi:MAG TPA: thioether cross-link-forming SCIFF peptide maturase [Eubacteriales bacterium]|nr:thioether cross-link-forming SCIFF peptide maturase [Eubacteriales bacterium]
MHSFQFQDKFILVDVESGALHELDEPAFRVVQAVERGEDPLKTGVDETTVREVLADLEELKEAGAYQAEALVAPEIPGGSAIKSMCLHVAHDCNLRCKYCFAATGDFHGERMLMPLSVGKRALEFLMEHSGSRKHLEVDLFGGEPLMNWPVCVGIVEYGRELEKKYGKKINFTITTNCVALTDDMIEFINREMHNVVISLDGRKEVHDAMRPTVNGKGSFDVILKNAKKLVAGRGDKEYYIRGTFTRDNLDFLEDVKAIVGYGFDQLSIEPAVLDEDSPYSLKQEHLPRIYEEYDALADFYLESRKQHDTWFNFFHFMFDPVGGPCLRKRINGCGAGTEYVAVTPDGDLYPCHQFVGMEEWKIGTLDEGILREDLQAQFLGCNVCTKETCKNCWAKYYCSGGCMANAFLYGGALDHPHDISCALMRKRFECAIGAYLAER